MALSEGFVKYVLDQLSAWDGVSVRKMFGGAGLYRDGKMFGLIAADQAYLKVDDSNRAQFEEAGSAPFKPFPDKPTTMSYYDVPADILDSPEQLVDWSKQSLAIQTRKS